VSLIRDERSRDREAVVGNVHHQVSRITQDDLIMKKVRSNEILVTGAFYEISSGIVDFFGEITDATSEKEVKILKRKSLCPQKFNLFAPTAPTGGSDTASSGKTDSAGRKELAFGEAMDDESEEGSSEDENPPPQMKNILKHRATGFIRCDLPSLLKNGSRQGSKGSRQGSKDKDRGVVTLFEEDEDEEEA